MFPVISNVERDVYTCLNYFAMYRFLATFEMSRGAIRSSCSLLFIRPFNTVFFSLSAFFKETFQQEVALCSFQVII